jgi:tRNA pseudouridine32 synthase / 23S rRNA pseudouridine746 synthase
MTTNASNTKIPTLLYQDEDLIIINKTPGLLSTQDGYDPQLPHLKSILEPHYGSLWMVHRLDKDTSGVMLIARNPEAHRILNQSFRERLIEKKYHGLVTPVPEWREMDINLPLKTNADRKHRTRVNKSVGKNAHSICKVHKSFDLGVLMEINIMTGTTHQIRAHLRAFNLALLGDLLYSAGLPPQPFIVPRVMLHARSLAFKHPSSGDWLSVSASYTEDFRNAYTKLKATTAQDAMI